MNERVAIVAIGMVTPLGRGFARFAEQLLAGVSAVRTIAAYDASAQRSRIAAEIPDFALAEHIGADEAARIVARYDRKVELGIAAASDVLAELGDILHDLDRTRIGVCLASSLSYPTPADLARELASHVREDGTVDRDALARTPPRYVDRFRYDEVARWLAARIDAQGPCVTHFAACAASAQALGDGFVRIRRGELELCFVGGHDANVNPFTMTAFSRFGALSQRNAEPARASRPFDRDRDGFVIGEGAVVLALEAWSRARAHGHPIIGEIVGYGSSLDAARVTAPHPQGRGAVLSMRRALADAGVSASAIDYVNAHGTSTALNDSTEAAAIREVLGPHAPAVSSSKSMFGHLLAGAGAIEAAACLVAFARAAIPPTINLERVDPACELDHVVGVPRAAHVDLALSNSFAFGGQNATLVLGHPERSPL